MTHSASRPPSGLSDGEHTFYVRAKDEAGNEDQSLAERTFTVDATEPQLSLPADIIQEATGGNGAKVVYTTMASDEVDGSVDVTCIPASDTTFGLGTTQVNCSATDQAGNEATGGFNVTVQDATKPQTGITEGPGGTTSDNTPTFSFSGLDSVSAAADLLYSHKVDNGGWSEYSSQTSVTLGGETGLFDGPHTFSVKAKDQADNVDESPADRPFTVQSSVVAPPPSVTPPPSAQPVKDKQKCKGKKGKALKKCKKKKNR